MTIVWAFLIVEILCLVGVAADYYLKVAGVGPEFLKARPFLIGCLLYASTGFGWFLVMKYMSLVQMGVLYGASIVILLAGLGVLKFGEKLTAVEILGIVMAIGGVILTSRFSES
jgi:drug/metabolite transporter (DMT)-like permease